MQLPKTNDPVRRLFLNTKALIGCNLPQLANIMTNLTIPEFPVRTAS